MAPTKLTPQTQRLLVRAIEKGLRTKIDICSFADITPATLNIWQRQAEAGDEGAAALFAALDRARARRKALYLRKMQLAGRDDWRMWREMLTLVDPDEYGKQPALGVEVSGAMTVVLTWGDHDDHDELGDGGGGAADVEGGAAAVA